MSIERALKFIDNLKYDLDKTHSNYHIHLPRHPSQIYRYLSCIGKGDTDFLGLYKSLMSHRGYLMVTYGDLVLDRITGLEVATFMYSPTYRGILYYMGKWSIPPESEDFLIQEGSPYYYKYLDCCDLINNWFFNVNKRDLLNIYLESEALSDNVVLEYVTRGLESKSFLTESKVKSLFKGLFPSNLHFYHIDLGKDRVQEIS